jgi:hypothetical protein
MARRSEKQTVTKADVGKLNIQAGTATVVGRAGQRKDAVAKYVESFMVQAVQLCHDKGITDPNVIRAAQLKARDLALENVTKELAKG